MSPSAEPLGVTVDKEVRTLVEQHDAADTEALSNFALQQVHSSVNFIKAIDDMTKTYENQKQRDAMREAVREMAAQNLGETLLQTQLLGIQFKIRGEAGQPQQPDDWPKERFYDELETVANDSREQFRLVNDRQPQPEELVRAMAPNAVEVSLKMLAAKPTERNKIAKTLGSTLLYHFAPQR